MSKQEQQFRSIEEVLAAAEHEFQVDLSDAGAVHAKAVELAGVANRSNDPKDYAVSNRLTELFEAYQDFAAPEVQQKVA